MVSALSAPHFHDEKAAFAYVEARVWPEGPVCPHCGGIERIGLMGGKSTRSQELNNRSGLSARLVISQLRDRINEVVASKGRNNKVRLPRC